MHGMMVLLGAWATIVGTAQTDPLRVQGSTTVIGMDAVALVVSPDVWDAGGRDARVPRDKLSCHAFSFSETSA